MTIENILDKIDPLDESLNIDEIDTEYEEEYEEDEDIEDDDESFSKRWYGK